MQINTQRNEKSTMKNRILFKKNMWGWGPAASTKLKSKVHKYLYFK